MKDNITQIINIGKRYSDLDFDAIKSQIADKDIASINFRFKDISECSLDDLIYLLKGTIICEMLSYSYRGCGSATSTSYIYSQLVSTDYEEALKIKVWARKLGFKNAYFPYGTVAYTIQPYEDALRYSSDAKEKEIALQRINEYNLKVTKREKRVQEEQEKAQKRREYEKYLKENDNRDRENGLIDILYKKLETLSSFEQLEIMASDTKHSPKFYPSSMAYNISSEDIERLDKEKKENLKKMLSIKIKGPSPWAKFKKSYKELLENSN